MTTTIEAPEIATADPASEDIEIHIVRFRFGVRDRTALCGARFEEIVKGGAATCKTCIRERMKLEGPWET